jgi:hypothetical protein
MFHRNLQVHATNAPDATQQKKLIVHDAILQRAGWSHQAMTWASRSRSEKRLAAQVEQDSLDFWNQLRAHL